MGFLNRGTHCWWPQLSHVTHCGLYKWVCRATYYLAHIDRAAAGGRLDNGNNTKSRGWFQWTWHAVFKYYKNYTLKEDFIDSLYKSLGFILRPISISLCWISNKIEKKWWWFTSCVKNWNKNNDSKSIFISLLKGPSKPQEFRLFKLDC